MWVLLKPVILLLVVGVGLSLGSDLSSAHFDDLGSGNVASIASLPNGVTNSSKDAVIDEDIIAANIEDGSTFEENEELYVEVEEEAADGSGGSGSVDHGDLFQSDMFDLVDGDDVGSGEGQNHEEVNGSGAEDKHDVGSIGVNERIGGDVVNGYRIMGVSSNQVVPDDSVDESLVEYDDISLEVNAEAVATSDLPLDVTEAAVTSELPLDITSEVTESELPLDVSSEAQKVDSSSTEPVKETEDDLGFLGMIASKRAMGTFPTENAVTEASSHNEHDEEEEEEEDHDINDILDYLNSVETTTPPEEDIFDYLNAIEARQSGTTTTTTATTTTTTTTTTKEYDYDYDYYARHSGRLMSAGQGHTSGAGISVFISFAIVCFFL